MTNYEKIMQSMDAYGLARLLHLANPNCGECLIRGTRYCQLMKKGCIGSIEGFLKAEEDKEDGNAH